ncbi:hypothetical protein OIU84_010847 [Salix udensis]|uniref:Protein kinase domain-containing protein n=1 Tax=Salix udensis TaxID=889485 RepID=A0AAD6JNT7_9ROSI|nr:hypothetical protein OIU84_010847 [Salix udensis]
MKFPFCGSSCFSSGPKDAIINNSSSRPDLDCFLYKNQGLLEDGSVVAVKVLSVENESMRGEREFISEIAALSDVRHENLVILRGCCVDGANRYLVYDYMENNSLVHTLLEHGEHYLVQKAWEAYMGNNLLQIVDPALHMDFPEEEALRFLMVGLLCVQETAKLRPRMSTTVTMLTNENDIKDVQISQPGLLSDLMDIRLRQKHSSQRTQTTFSRGSTTASTHSTSYF